ncbi:serine hydrolase [Candidatus Omnitrophota bacterium]
MKKISGIMLCAALCFHISGTATLSAAPQKPDEGKTKQILAEFEDYARKTMRDWRIPGMAVAIIADDRVIFSKGFGVKEINGSDPVDAHTIFQIGSASKAFTAALAAMMVDEGKMAWKDNVIDHVPGFRMYDAWVTREFMIEDLLAQHSGMPAYAADFQAIAGFDRDHIMNSIRYIKPVSSFRSEFAYVNNLFLVAARAIENKTGKTWEADIRARIFEPLGMDESSTGRDSLVSSKNAATGHNIQEGKVAPVPKTLNWPYIYGPAGGINSNVLDMAEWVRLQINDGIVDGKRLVGEENMNFIHTPKTITPPRKGDRMYYCESWVYEEMRPYPLVWHNGGTTGFHAFVGFWTEPKIGIVILTNEASNKLAEALPHYFNDLYFGNPARDWSAEKLGETKKREGKMKAGAPKRPDPPSPPLALEEYTGAYHNEVYLDAAVTKRDGSLAITIGPDRFEIIAAPWDRDTFYFNMMIFGDGNEGFVEFSRDPEGRIARMTIDALNEDGCGAFDRVD